MRKDSAGPEFPMLDGERRNTWLDGKRRGSKIFLRGEGCRAEKKIEELEDCTKLVVDRDRTRKE